MYMLLSRVGHGLVNVTVMFALLLGVCLYYHMYVIVKCVLLPGVR